MKTIPNKISVKEFIEAVSNEKRKADAYQMLQFLEELTGLKPQMWGQSIVGFGSYHYVYDSGREGDMMLTGFSPRKQNLAVYIMNGCDRYKEALKRMGPHKVGKSCLYLKNFQDIDLNILKDIIKDSIQFMQKKYP